MSNVDRTRPVWMNQEGGPLYDAWATEVVMAADAPHLWTDYIRMTEVSNPGILNGLVLDPHNVFRTLFRKDDGMVKNADEQAGASERLLMPRMDEILHYTSAKVFMEKGLSGEQSVAVHARDSLRFAMAVAVGLTQDVFAERTQQAQDMLNSLFGVSSSDDGRAIFSTLEAIRKIVGPLWDTSLEESSMEYSPEALERVFRLQTLAFIQRSLGNASLHACLEEFSVTAFDTLGDGCTVLGTKKLEPAENHDEASAKIHNSYGWQYRARYFGLLKASHPSRPKAVLAYDSETDAFTAPTKIIDYLRNALREQNQNGLKLSAFKTAGNIQNLEAPLSVGCPVHNMGSIALAADFAGKAFGHMIDYHQAHPYPGPS